MSYSSDIDQQGTNGNYPTAGQRQRKKTDRRYLGASEREENVDVRVRSLKVPALITKILVNYEHKQKQRRNLCLLRDQWVLSTTSKYDFVMIKKVGVITT